MIRTAVLVPSSERLNPSGRTRTRVGGADMRFVSLQKALDRAFGCVLIESPCERSTICRERCAVAGGTRPVDDELPWYFDRAWCPAAADDLARRFDDLGVTLVVCSSLNVYRYVADLAARGRFTVAFDIHNVESALYAEMFAVKRDDPAFADVLDEENAARMAAAESAAIGAADEVWTCTRDDVELVRRTYPTEAGDAPVRVVRDVVDVPSEPPDDFDPSHVVFTARLDYYPNALAAETLLRDVAPLVDAMPVVVAGAQPPDSLVEMPVPGNGRLVADPPDIAEIQRGGIMAVPLTLGGGSRFKIIEAFAAGIPVVSTLKGAEGLEADPGTHYVQAESPEEIAAAVKRLTVDDVARRATVRSAWELAVERYSISALTEQMSGLGHLVDRRRSQDS